MQSNSERTKELRVIGLDVSDRKTEVCELGRETGDVLDRWRVETTPDRIAAAFESRQDIERIALEVGKQSPWLSRLLKDLGLTVTVANARKVGLIHQNRRKSDRVDAECLARLARADVKLLHPIEHRSRGAQVGLTTVRARDLLVRSRTQMINHVRGAVKSLGGKISKCSSRSFARRAMDELPKDLQPSLLPVLRTIQDLTERIDAYDRQIEERIRTEYPECELLLQVPGVGAVTALTYRLVIDDPKRFKRSRMVGAYVGLVPGQDQSGESSPELPITKTGDALLRRLLIQAAQYILGPFGKDCDLRRHGDKLESRGGKRAKRMAVVAVARKLAVLLHRLWIAGEVYDPLHVAKQQQEAA